MRILKFIALAALVAFTQTGIVSGSASIEQEVRDYMSTVEEYNEGLGASGRPSSVFARVPVHRSNLDLPSAGDANILTVRLPQGGSEIDEWKTAFNQIFRVLEKHDSGQIQITKVIIPEIYIASEVNKDELSNFVHDWFDSKSYSLQIAGTSGINAYGNVSHTAELLVGSRLLLTAALGEKVMIVRFKFPGRDNSQSLSSCISRMTNLDQLIDPDLNQNIQVFGPPSAGPIGVGGAHAASSPRSPPLRTSSTLESTISAPRSRSGSPSPSRSQSPSPPVLRPSSPNIGGSSLHGGLSGDAYVQQFGVRAPDQPQRTQLVGAEDEEDEDMRQAIAMSLRGNRALHGQAEDDADVERAIRESQEVYEAMIASQIASLEANVLDDEAQILAEIEQFERMQALEQSTASGKSVVKNELARAMAESSREYNAYLMQKYLDYARAHDMTVTEVRELSRDPEALQKILAEESVDKSGKARSTPSHSRARRVSRGGVKPSANTGAAHLSPAANDDDDLKAAIALSLHKSP